MPLYKNLLLLFTLTFCHVSHAQYELASPDPAINTPIAAGSLIIPMDTTLQRLPGIFNMKTYGLINYLLQNEIPVKWAIKGNKAKTNAGSGGIDFTTATSRVYPDTTASMSTSFRSGPFIIDNDWVQRALPFINSYQALYNNSIAIYKLTSATNIDIRYTLTFKPKVYLLNHNGYDTLLVSVFKEGGYSSANYTLSLPANQVFNENDLYSIVYDAHYDKGDTTHINPVMRYVNRGGNLMADCAAQGSYENHTFTLTTTGIDTVPSSPPSSITAPAYLNHKLPIAQFDGPLITPSGEYKWWFIKSGGSFRANAYQLFRYTTTGLSPNIPVTVLAGAKVKPNAEKGGNVFYLGGHDYFFNASGSSNENNKINGRRILLNASLIPPSDTMDLDFTTDVDLAMTAPGLAVKNENHLIYIVLRNLKGGTAKNIEVNITLPAGLSYISHTSTVGAYNSGTGIWTIGSRPKNSADTLYLSCKVLQLGTMSVSGMATNTAYETILPNNNFNLIINGVSRPVAEADTAQFTGPYAVDKNTWLNDSDEDGGPFGNTSIHAGPFNGSAYLIGNDTIRYVPNATFTGIDSMLYVICDNYLLCDSAWLFINVVTPLPVELTHFTGVRNNGEVRLTWITASEKENDFFAVERSSNGKNFEDRGQVKGAGTTTEEQRYSFSEKDTYAAVLYYRLRQYDWNGDTHVSKTIALLQDKKNSFSLAVYPNPLTLGNDLILQALTFNGEAQITINDLTGRRIYMRETEATEEGLFEVIHTSGILQKGCFIITLTSDRKTASAILMVN